MNREDYKKIIKAQVTEFNRVSTPGKGDWAQVDGNHNKGFKDGDIVKVISRTSTEAYAKKWKKSVKANALPIDLNNLTKIYMVPDGPDGEEGMLSPIKVIAAYRLSEKPELHELFLYLGRRAKQIFAKEFYEDKVLDAVEDKIVDGLSVTRGPVPVPVINPLIVEAEFVDQRMIERGVQGFVQPLGIDKGVIFINSGAGLATKVDEVVAHEFMHLMAFYSKDLAEKLDRPELQLGVFDDEADDEARKQKAKEDRVREEMEEVVKGRPRTKQEAYIEGRIDYFNKPTEMFAHTEQVLWTLEKEKVRDLRDANSGYYATPEDKQDTIDMVLSRKPEYYKKRALNTFIAFSKHKYGVNGDVSEPVYEMIFDNLDYYMTSAPAGEKLKLFFPKEITKPESKQHPGGAERKYRGLTEEELKQKGFDIPNEPFIENKL